jgi:hypothetical protein
MALGTAFINLVIPIENIEKKYSGGFEQYKRDNEYVLRSFIYTSMQKEGVLVI